MKKSKRSVYLSNLPTRVIREIPLELIDVDRLPLNPTGFCTAIAVLFRIPMPPVHLQLNPNRRYKLLDGRHRYLACKLNGKTVIKARYSMRVSLCNPMN